MTDPRDRIIVALDVKSASDAQKLVEQLKPHVGSFKIGLEFITGTLARMFSLDEQHALAEYDSSRKLFKTIGEKLFWDGKFKDIPNTVGGASKPLSLVGVKMFNVHCDGGSAMMKQAVKDAESVAHASTVGFRPLILGVTILTSMEDADLNELEAYPQRTILPIQEGDPGYVAQRVHHLALLAKECGLDGVVCSPREAAGVRRLCGSDFLIVTPCIRASDAPPDDQKRTMTPGQAIMAGADQLVIGRPITGAKDPVEAAQRTADEIQDAHLQMQKRRG
ncbi:orotidine-5'-phosphate decarboxylase [Patescibacteria group bacterium]|nr:orotidine-5'-phosphate decarboxylase [Patescibacteria group bacterium]